MHALNGRRSDAGPTSRFPEAGTGDEQHPNRLDLSRIHRRAAEASALGLGPLQAGQHALADHLPLVVCEHSAETAGFLGQGTNPGAGTRRHFKPPCRSPDQGSRRARIGNRASEWRAEQRRGGKTKKLTIRPVLSPGGQNPPQDGRAIRSLFAESERVSRSCAQSSTRAAARPVPPSPSSQLPARQLEAADRLLPREPEQLIPAA